MGKTENRSGVFLLLFACIYHFSFIFFCFVLFVLIFFLCFNFYYFFLSFPLGGQYKGEDQVQKGRGMSQIGVHNGKLSNTQ